MLNAHGKVPPDDVGRRCTVRGSVHEIEEMQVDISTHNQSLSAECLHYEINSLFLYFCNNEHIVWHVCSKTLDIEREWRESPPLDRLLAYCRRDTNKMKGMIPQYIGGEEASAKNRDGM